MKIYKVTMILRLGDDADSPEWIEKAIEECLEPNEEIMSGTMELQGVETEL
jgi:hypothetical protein